MCIASKAGGNRQIWHGILQPSMEIGLSGNRRVQEGIGRSWRTTTCVAVVEKGMSAWPFYSNPFPSLVKIFQDSGFKSLPPQLQVSDLWFSQLQNIYLSELVDSCKGKLWLNIDPLVSFFVADQKKKPSFAMFEWQTVPRDTKNPSNLRTLWH